MLHYVYLLIFNSVCLHLSAGQVAYSTSFFLLFETQLHAVAGNYADESGKPVKQIGTKKVGSSILSKKRGPGVCVWMSN